MFDWNLWLSLWRKAGKRWKRWKMLLLTSTERVVSKRFESMIGMHVIWVCRILCFISWIHLCDSQEKKINGIPTENKDNMISSIAKMSEGGRPKNKWQVKICKSCQKGRLGFFSISSELETQLVVQDFLISKH